MKLDAMKRLRGLALALVLTAPWAGPAAASTAPASAFVATPDRHALLIANADYPGERRDLLNPVNDVRLVARTLQQLGFKVTVVENADRATLRQSVATFADGLPRHATALVYYAGHGVQIGGSNLLLPVDSALRSEAAVSQEAYPVKTLLNRLSSSASAVNVVILDACRNNPFQPPPGNRLRSWSVDGLAREAVQRGTVIAYSTAPGEVAADGAGSNSLFAQALARELVRQQHLEQALKRAGAWVRQQTRDEQIPWVESSLAVSLYLTPPPGQARPAVTRELVARPATPQGASRGLDNSELWFTQMSTIEWQTLEYSIQQRVKGFTPDELPALTRRANAGSVVAMTTLGLVYREGVDRSVNERMGTTRSRANNTEAVRWLERAAKAGFPMAQNELGEMYFAGRAVERNPRLAREWLERAAASGYWRAQLNLKDLAARENPTPENLHEVAQELMRSIMGAQGTRPQ